MPKSSDDGAMSHAIAILGSASDVGKSLVAAGLGRLLSDAGLDVAPFKAQNMANQAGVTSEGLEMPRAQMLQAQACRVEPHVDMGPVLLKPICQTEAQVVVLGKAQGIREARDYFRDTSILGHIAAAALDRLAQRHACLVLEGAGSPVEINLMSRDFVNLRPARQVQASLILVLDIHKGGVFAQAKGTLDLLPEEDRKRVLGLVVNRFQGDPALFQNGILDLERLCGVPVLALVPHLEHGLDEEDRPFPIPLDAPPAPNQLNIGAVISPRVSNTEDLAPLLAEPDAHLTWISHPELALAQDFLILPGSKATLGDLATHVSTGMAEAIRQAHHNGTWILGICGGYQMLGAWLEDPKGTEGGPARWPGLGLLPTQTTFHAQKTTRQSAFSSQWPTPGHTLSGYEIHHGQTKATGPGDPLLQGAGAEIGWRQGRVLGSYLHGMLQANGWRGALLNEIRRSRGLADQPVQNAHPLDIRLQRWARHLQHSLRPGAWEKILRAAGKGPAS